jgi:low affinity Fe/Cu permease
MALVFATVQGTQTALLWVVAVAVILFALIVAPKLQGKGCVWNITIAIAVLIACIFVAAIIANAVTSKGFLSMP